MRPFLLKVLPWKFRLTNFMRQLLILNPSLVSSVLCLELKICNMTITEFVCCSNSKRNYRLTCRSSLFSFDVPKTSSQTFLLTPDSATTNDEPVSHIWASETRGAEILNVHSKSCRDVGRSNVSWFSTANCASRSLLLKTTCWSLLLVWHHLLKFAFSLALYTFSKMEGFRFSLKPKRWELMRPSRWWFGLSSALF
jgi:hypothetical protein